MTYLQFHLVFTLPAELREYDIEELWNIEVGFKGGYGGGRGTAGIGA